MNKIVYISPEGLGSLTGISYFANSPSITKLLRPTNYHFILFSTLYQSGANYFQTYDKGLPIEISKSKFWKEKIIGINYKAYQTAKNKTEEILQGKLSLNLDDERGRFLKFVVEMHLSNLFYATQTGNSFINIHKPLSWHLKFLEKWMDKELWLGLRNLSTLIKEENITTITPKYTILKKDVKRFEEISSSRLFKDYQNSMELIEVESKVNKVKKEILSNSLKLFNKYGNYISINETAINFFKFGKKIIDSFASIIPSFVGDFLVSSAETMIKNKRTIQFYQIEEVTFENILTRRIEEVIKEGGVERFKEIIKEINTP